MARITIISSASNGFVLFSFLCLIYVISNGDKLCRCAVSLSILVFLPMLAAINRKYVLWLFLKQLYLLVIVRSDDRKARKILIGNFVKEYSDAHP